MRIVLIEPLDSSRQIGLTCIERIEPLGLAYIASVLQRAGHDVQVIHQVDPSFEQLMEQIIAFEPEVVGISAQTHVISRALHIAESTKSCCTARIVLGGWHPSALPEIAKHRAVDFVVVGEGERTMLELASAIERDALAKPVPGTALARDGRLIVSPPRPRIWDLDQLPFPLREQLPMNLYRRVVLSYPPSSKHRFASVSASRGCLRNCSFCNSPGMWGREYVHRSVDSILGEIQELISAYNIDYLLFRDEDFTTCRQFVVGLCEEMISRNIRLSWNCIARIDEVDSELLCLMKQAGCFEIAFGLESGDDFTLGKIGKGYDTRTSVANLWKVHEAGIKTGCLFMIGFPWDNVETLEATREFITKIPYDRLRIAFATPFPGTALWHTCFASDSILTRDYARYTTDEPIFKLQGLSSDDLIDFRDKELGTRMYFCEVYRKRAVDAITKEPHLFDSYFEWFQFLCRLLPETPSLSKWWHAVANDLPYSILHAVTSELPSLAGIGKKEEQSTQTLVRCDAKKVDRSDQQVGVRIEIERSRRPAPPPRIVGAISTAEVKAARLSGQMLQLSLMLGSVCNLRCVYCFTDAADGKVGELEWDEIEHIVRQFKDLGGKTVIVPGAGEPTLSPHIGPLARLGSELGLSGIIYTNGSRLDRPLASLLYDCGWSIFVKFNSFDPKVQNRLAGDTTGIYTLRRNHTLATLMDMGFNNELPAPAISRLGIVTSIMEANKNEIPDIFRFARNHNLTPSMDNLLETGRGRGCRLGLVEAECDEVVFGLKRIDEKEYRYSWNPHSFAVAGDCLSLYVGLCVHATGKVSPCLGTEIEVGDVRRQTLHEIWESERESWFRNIDRHIEGPCRTCSIHIESLCYGCVGRRLQSLPPNEMENWDRVTNTAFRTTRCPAYHKDKREHSCQIEVQEAKRLLWRNS